MSDMRDDRGAAQMDLQKAMERLNSLLGLHGQVAKARGMPEAAMRIFDQQVKITGRAERWDEDKAAASAVDMAKEVADTCRARITGEHEAKRDNRLRAIADEIDQIRRVLPALTTAAVVELGGKAKDLRVETGRK